MILIYLFALNAANTGIKLRNAEIITSLFVLYVLAIIRMLSVPIRILYNATSALNTTSDIKMGIGKPITQLWISKTVSRMLQFSTMLYLQQITLWIHYFLNNFNLKKIKRRGYLIFLILPFYKTFLLSFYFFFFSF